VPTPALEEANVLDAVREMLSDPRSKPHRLVIDEVFDQADDRMSSVLYDIDLKKAGKVFYLSGHLPSLAFFEIECQCDH